MSVEIRYDTKAWIFMILLGFSELAVHCVGDWPRYLMAGHRYRIVTILLVLAPVVDFDEGQKELFYLRGVSLGYICFRLMVRVQE